MRKLFIFIILITLFIGFFLRFYALGEVPNGMYQDETAIGYNAYSILKTGKDEYGVSFPLYFKSFGDYKLPVYIYTTVISEAAFGLTNFAVRLPSAFFGFLTLALFFPFMKLITRSNATSLVATILLAITPWHLHYNRATFEVSISLFLYVLGCILLLSGLRRKKAIFFILGSLFFVVNIYTYNLTRLLSPILYLLILILERNRIKDQTRGILAFTFLLMLLFILPFILTLFAAGGAGSAGGTLIWSSASVQAQLLEFRSYLFYLPVIIQKMFFSMPVLTFWQFVVNVASYLSVPFFFISGSTHGNHGIGNVGQFYLFELPLFLIGLFVAFQKKQDGTRFFLFSGAMIIILASFTRESPHATRSFLLIPTFLYFIATGTIAVFSYFLKSRKAFFIRTIMFFCFVLVSLNIAYYFASYYVRFPIAYSPMWSGADRELSEFIKQNQDKYDKIIVDSHTGLVYTSLLYYLAYPPDLFQSTVVRYPDDSEGFSKVKEFGKFTYKDIDWYKDSKLPKTLIITTPNQSTGSLPVLRKLVYPQRPVVAAVGQKIMQFPVSDPAYVVLEAKP